ncbi:hypothetical protein HAX54_019187, partial [Datura stramonium]|nr:hypothetical protein [Datura stramonium]
QYRIQQSSKNLNLLDLQNQRNVKKPAAPSSLTKQSVVPSSAIIDEVEIEVEGEHEDENGQSILRPKVISEARTRFNTKRCNNNQLALGELTLREMKLV